MIEPQDTSFTEKLRKFKKHKKMTGPYTPSVQEKSLNVPMKKSITNMSTTDVENMKATELSKVNPKYKNRVNDILYAPKEKK